MEFVEFFMFPNEKNGELKKVSIKVREDLVPLIETLNDRGHIKKSDLQLVADAVAEMFPSTTKKSGSSISFAFFGLEDLCLPQVVPKSLYFGNEVDCIYHFCDGRVEMYYPSESHLVPCEVEILSEEEIYNRINAHQMGLCQ